MAFVRQKHSGPEATQEAVFARVCGGAIDAVLDGLNATIFAYGQVLGSGAVVVVVVVVVVVWLWLWQLRVLALVRCDSDKLRRIHHRIAPRWQSCSRTRMLLLCRQTGSGKTYTMYGPKGIVTDTTMLLGTRARACVLLQAPLSHTLGLAWFNLI